MPNLRERAVDFLFGPKIPKVVRPTRVYANSRKEAYDSYNEGLKNPASVASQVGYGDEPLTDFELGRLAKTMAPNTEKANREQIGKDEYAGGLLGSVRFDRASPEVKKTLTLNRYLNEPQFGHVLPHEIGHLFDDAGKYRPLYIPDLHQRKWMAEQTGSRDPRVGNYDEYRADAIGLFLSDPNRALWMKDPIAKAFSDAPSVIPNVYNARRELADVDYWRRFRDKLAGLKP